MNLSLKVYELPVPAVTIIMPNYNKGKYIEYAIESVLMQTFQDFELIIVDDASTDESVEIAKRYAEKDVRIRLVINEKNRGVSFSRNTGIKTAKASIICFLDSDDEYHRFKLERQFQTLIESAGETVVYSNAWKMDENDTVISTRYQSGFKGSGMIYGQLLAARFFAQSTIMLPKSCSEILEKALPISS